jgi:acetyltransferase
MTATTEDIRAAVLDAIGTCAPESKPAELPCDRPLGGLVDLDSLDWVNLQVAIQERLRAGPPPASKCRESSIDAIVDYLAGHGADAAQGPAGAPDAADPPDVQVHQLRGMAVTVRPMRSDDEKLEAAFVRHLSEESRYLRFMGAVKELPAAKLEQLTHVDQRRHVALVAVVDLGAHQVLAGVVRYVIDAAGTSCEFAATIDDEWQGSGLAGILMDRLIALARSRGLQVMEGLVLRTNTRMLKLARQLGFRREAQAGGPETVRISLPLQDPMKHSIGRDRPC